MSNLFLLSRAQMSRICHVFRRHMVFPEWMTVAW